MVVKQAVANAHGGHEGGERDGEAKIKTECECHRAGEHHAESREHKNSVQRAPNDGVFIAGLIGIKACCRQPDPVQKQRVQDNRESRGYRVLAKALRPKKAGNQQSECEIENGIDQKRADNEHCKEAPELSRDTAILQKKG